MTFTPQRHLADADDVLHAILAATGVSVGANLPADLTDRLPYVAARRFGGSVVDAEHLDRATVSVDAWASTRREAADLAETCRVLLHDAWITQAVYAGATISALTESSAPSELRTAGQPENVWRFNAAYSLFIRS